MSSFGFLFVEKLDFNPFVNRLETKGREKTSSFEHRMDRKMMKIVIEDIVISGMSGRFPESDSTDEFAKNLYDRVDMITEDNRRWPTGWSFLFLSS